MILRMLFNSIFVAVIAVIVILIYQLAFAGGPLDHGFDLDIVIKVGIGGAIVGAVVGFFKKH